LVLNRIRWYGKKKERRGSTFSRDIFFGKRFTFQEKNRIRSRSWRWCNDKLGWLGFVLFFLLGQLESSIWVGFFLMWCKHYVIRARFLFVMHTIFIHKRFKWLLPFVLYTELCPLLFVRNFLFWLSFFYLGTVAELGMHFLSCMIFTIINVSVTLEWKQTCAHFLKFSTSLPIISSVNVITRSESGKENFQIHRIVLLISENLCTDLCTLLILCCTCFMEWPCWWLKLLVNSFHAEQFFSFVC